MKRLVIAEDDSLLRQTLAELLQLGEDLRVVAAYPNGKLVLDNLEQDHPDLILSDIEMPQMDGISMTKEVRSRYPDVQVIILTKFGDDEKLFLALKAGALGYVLKDAGFEEIKLALSEAAQGMGHLSPALVTRVMREFGRLSDAVSANKELFAELSHREVEVLEKVGQGLRNKVIAEQLSLSEKTVKTHVGAILRKLHLNDRTEAALLAQKHGLTN